MQTPPRSRTALTPLPVRPRVTFKIVPEHPRYAVGDDGSVWSRAPLGKAVGYSTWRPLKPRPNQRGYLRVALTDRTDRYVHRIVAAAFVGSPPFEGSEVVHIDDDRTNNRATNLRWATHAEVIGLAKINGRILDGEAHPLSQIDSATARRVMALVDEGRTHREIAAILAIPKPTVDGISCGHSWARATGKRPANRPATDRPDLSSITPRGVA